MNSIDTTTNENMVNEAEAGGRKNGNNKPNNVRLSFKERRTLCKYRVMSKKKNTQVLFLF